METSLVSYGGQQDAHYVKCFVRVVSVVLLELLTLYSVSLTFFLGRKKMFNFLFA